MLKAIKAMPVFAKIALGSLVLLLGYGLSHRHRARTAEFSNDEAWPATGQRAAYRGDDDGAAMAQRGDDRDEQGQMQQGQVQQYLAQLKAQQAQVMGQTHACMAQMNQATNQMAMAAMNGQMTGQAPCAQAMPQLIAQEAFLEAQIYRLQSGDMHSSLQQITGVQMGPSGSGSYYRPSGPGNDGGIGAVERYDRQAIRGTSMYGDEDGTQRELPTQPYYFRDRASGEIVSSTSGEAPNNGRDYAPLTAQE